MSQFVEKRHKHKSAKHHGAAKKKLSQTQEIPTKLTRQQKKLLKKALKKQLREQYGQTPKNFAVAEDDVESLEEYSGSDDYAQDYAQDAYYDDSEQESDDDSEQESVESFESQESQESVESSESQESAESQESVESQGSAESADSQEYHQVAEDGEEMDLAEEGPMTFEDRMDALFEIEEQLTELARNQHEDEVALVSDYEQSRGDLYEGRADVIATMPGFWATAIANHPVFGPLIYNPPNGSMLDAELLDYIESVKVDRHPDDFRDITITFEFVENPFFKNEKLTKSFRWNEEDDEFEVYQTTEIEWVGGLEHGIDWNEKIKGNKNASPKARRLIKQIRKSQRREQKLARSQASSIFTWFEDETDVSVGILIAEDLYARATHWFLGLDDQEVEAGSESESEDSDVDYSEGEGSDQVEEFEDEEIDSDEIPDSEDISESDESDGEMQQE